LDKLVLECDHLHYSVTKTQTLRSVLSQLQLYWTLQYKMLHVKGECVKAEFKAQFKNSGALVQKHHCSF
jgi:hypothetical protein